jgi:hypothetical protein
MINVICSKWGDKYSIDYVNRLYNMVSRNLKADFKFYCQTDDTVGMNPKIEQLPFLTDLPDSTPEAMMSSKDFMNGLPRLWDRPKLNYLKPDGWGLTGTKIALDLDMIIHNDMTPLLNLYNNKPIIGRSWWHDMEKEKFPDWRRRYGAKVNGSFYLWHDNDLEPIWNDLMHQPERKYFVFHGGTDNFLTTRHFDKFDLVPEEYYYSFNHSGNKIHHDKIICTFNTNANEFSRFEIHQWAKLNKEVEELWK